MRRRSTCSPASPNGARWSTSSPASRQRRCRHDGAAGRARDRGQAEPDREGAARRSRRLHRRRTRDRLAAAADPAGRQSEGRSGQPGYFLAADQITTLEKPSQLDRSEGDIHPQGNPHVQIDPHRVLAIAKALDARLARARSGATPRPTSSASPISRRAGRRRSSAGRRRPRRCKGARSSCTT